MNVSDFHPSFEGVPYLVKERRFPVHWPGYWENVYIQKTRPPSLAGSGLGVFRERWVGTEFSNSHS